MHTSTFRVPQALNGAGRSMPAPLAPGLRAAPSIEVGSLVRCADGREFTVAVLEASGVCELRCADGGFGRISHVDCVHLVPAAVVAAANQARAFMRPLTASEEAQMRSLEWLIFSAGAKRFKGWVHVAFSLRVAGGNRWRFATPGVGSGSVLCWNTDQPERRL